MKNRSKYALLNWTLFFGAAALAGSGLSAATFSLSLQADGKSRWYDYASDAFAQLDQGFNNNPNLDGFFLISSLPALVQIGSGANVFPFEGVFTNIGVLSYDDAAVVGVGTEMAAITGLSLNVSPFVADDDSVLNIGYATTVGSVSGSVTLVNGQVSAINLTAGVTFTYDASAFGLGVVPYSGVFVVAGDAFTLDVDDAVATAFGTFRYAWDVTGEVMNLATPLAPVVPEPGLAGLWAGLLAGLMLWRRRGHSGGVAAVGRSVRGRGVVGGVLNVVWVAVLGGMVLGAPRVSAALEIIQLAGPGAGGVLSLSNVKNWSDEPDPATESPFPYFFNSFTGVWSSIAAVPLSAGSIYGEESSFTVLNKSLTQVDFDSFSSGEIGYDDTLISGFGLEAISVGDLSLTFNDAGFSPLFSPYNVNDNFAWDYVIAASNLSGMGLSFVDGALVGIDLVADISVSVRFLGNDFFTWGSTYDGTFTIVGDSYAFDVAVIQDNVTPFGTFTDTQLLFNRSGLIASVVPEPGAGGLALGGFTWLILARRRRCCCPGGPALLR